MTKDPQAELLWWHHQLGHCSFKTLKALAKRSEVPKPLAKVQLPKCTECLFRVLGPKGMVNKRGKQQAHQVTTAHTSASLSIKWSACKSDSLPNQKSGLHANDTRQPPFLSTISHACNMSTSTRSSNQKRQLRQWALEKFETQQGVQVKQYHADNGRFAHSAFIYHCKSNHQSLAP